MQRYLGFQKWEWQEILWSLSLVLQLHLFQGYRCAVLLLRNDRCRSSQTTSNLRRCWCLSCWAESVIRRRESKRHLFWCTSRSMGGSTRDAAESPSSYESAESSSATSISAPTLLRAFLLGFTGRMLTLLLSSCSRAFCSARAARSFAFFSLACLHSSFFNAFSFFLCSSSLI